MTARRMGGTLHDMATANHADDAAIFDAVDRVLGVVAFAGGSTAIILWRGAELTLGHVIVLVVGFVAAGTLVWRRLRTRHSL